MIPPLSPLKKHLSPLLLALALALAHLPIAKSQTPAPSLTPTVLSIVSVVTQGKHFSLSRARGDPSQSLTVFFKIQVENLETNKVFAYTAETKFEPGETTKLFRLKKLRKLVAGNSKTKIIICFLPSPPMSTLSKESIMREAYVINPAAAYAVLF